MIGCWFLVVTAILQGLGGLFVRNFAVPLIGRWDLLGLIQDLLALATLIGVAVLAVGSAIRRNSTGTDFALLRGYTGRVSTLLFVLSNAVWTYALFRGASAAVDSLPFGSSAFLSQAMGALLAPLGESANQSIERITLPLFVGVMLVVLVIELNARTRRRARLDD